MKKISILAALGALVGTPAFAIALPPVQVPEPSMIGLTAVGAVGLVVAFRLRGRK